MRINFSNLQIAKSYAASFSAILKPAYISSPFTNLQRQTKDSFEKNQSVNFTAQAQKDSTKSFQIKNIKNLHCPACGLVMLDDNQIDQFVADVATARGAELIEALEKYEDESAITGVRTENPKTIYRPQKQEIVNILKELARIHPNEDISGLVQIEAKNHIDKLIASQLDVVSKLEEYIANSNMSIEQKAALKYIIDDHKSRIKGESEIEFQNKPFIYAILNAAPDEKVKQKITSITSNLPNSDSQIDSFFVKYEKKNRSAKEIAKKFVAQSIPSADHIIPKSRNGADSIRNYLCDCSDCNSKRSNTPFYEWQQTIPDFEQNLQEHIKEIRIAQEKGVIDTSYDSYITDLTRTIEKLSQGEISLDSKPVKDEQKHAREMIKRKQEIAKLNKSIKELEKKRRQVRAKILEFESFPQFQNFVQYQATISQIDELQLRINEAQEQEPDKAENLSKRIEKLEKKKDLLKAIIRPDEDVDKELEDNNLLLKAMIASNDTLNTVTRKMNRKASLEEKQAELKGLIQAAQKENNRIRSNPFFNKEDETNICEYYHLKDLYRTGDEIVMHQGKYRRKNVPQSERELVQMGMKAASQRITQLLEKDSVKFFLNKENLEQYKLQLAGIENELKSVEMYTQEVLDKAQREADEIAQGRTVKQIKDKIEELEHKQRIIHSEDDINELRAKDQKLKDSIAYYKDIKTKLKNYRNLSAEDFAKYISLASQ